jgi:hypothetical protein
LYLDSFAESPLRLFAWEAEREENDYLQVKENEKKHIDCKDLKV